MAVAAGSKHGLFATEEGLVYAWGDGHGGQLGSRKLERFPPGETNDDSDDDGGGGGGARGRPDLRGGGGLGSPGQAAAAAGGGALAVPRGSPATLPLRASGGEGGGGGGAGRKSAAARAVAAKKAARLAENARRGITTGRGLNEILSG